MSEKWQNRDSRRQTTVNHKWDGIRCPKAPPVSMLQSSQMFHLSNIWLQTQFDETVRSLQLTDEETWRHRRSQIFRNEFRRRDWHRQDTSDLLCKKLWKQGKTFKKTQVRVSQKQMCKTAIERENFLCYCVSTSQTSKGFKRICDMDNYILFEK